MNREADYAIKGFIYQFNKTLEQVLSEPYGTEIRVEGIIEDIDVVSAGFTKAIQCKYHETKQGYKLSDISKPILQMLIHYANNKDKNIQYILYAHFSDETEGEKTISKSDIETILKFLKQITAIFIASNKHSFTESYPELLEFINNKNSSELPSRYRFYMYLNNEGKNRNGHIHNTNKYGTVCDFTFRPFGFVLSIDNLDRLNQLSEITNFKYYHKIKALDKLPIILNKYPTHYPFPLDFRSLDELK